MNTIARILTAIIYLRVSDERQADGGSLDNQEKECRLWAAKEGYTIVAVFREEGGKGGRMDRAKLTDALIFCAKHKPDIFIVFKVDRFSRGTKNHFAIKAVLAKYGTSLRSATEPIDDSPVGNLIETILAGTAQFDNEIRGQRTKGVMEDLAKQGYWQHQAPFGYLNHRDALGRPTLAPHPKEGPLVTKAYKMFTEARLNEVEIAKKLSAYAGRKVHPQQVHRILNNPTYYGWNVTGLTPEGVQGQQKALIDEKTFLTVQHIKAGSRKHTAHAQRRHKFNAEFPLKPGLVCPRCNRFKITGSNSKGKGGNYFPYYHCSDPSCRGPWFAKKDVDSKFYELIDAIQVKPDYAEAFGAIVTEVWKEKGAEVTQYKSQLTQEVKKLETQILITAQKNTTGVLPDNVAKQLITELSSLKLTKEIELHDMDIEGYEIEAVLAYATHFLSSLKKIWINTPLERKGEFLKIVFPKGLIFENGNYRTPEISPLYEIIGPIFAEKSLVVARRGIGPLLQE